MKVSENSSLSQRAETVHVQKTGDVELQQDFPHAVSSAAVFLTSLFGATEILWVHIYIVVHQLYKISIKMKSPGFIFTRHTSNLDISIACTY